MPSRSASQHRLMAMVANDPKAAKRLKIPQSVGEEFMKADKGKKFGKGGDVKDAAMERKHVAAMKKAGVPKSIVKEEEAEAKAYKKGGAVKEARMLPAKMEKIPQGNKKFGQHAIQKKGLTKGKNLGDSGKIMGIEGGKPKNYKKGGAIDGCAQRGKTKGKVI